MLFLKSLTRINLFHFISITKRTENSENSTQADQSAFKRRRGRKIQPKAKLDCHQTSKKFL